MKITHSSRRYVCVEFLADTTQIAADYNVDYNCAKAIMRTYRLEGRMTRKEERARKIKPKGLAIPRIRDLVKQQKLLEERRGLRPWIPVPEFVDILEKFLTFDKA